MEMKLHYLICCHPYLQRHGLRFCSRICGHCAIDVYSDQKKMNLDFTNFLTLNMPLKNGKRLCRTRTH